MCIIYNIDKVFKNNCLGGNQGIIILISIYMRYEYIKETKELKDKSEKEQKLELIVNIIKTRNNLDNAMRNYEFAEGDLIDYYLYEIKANQSKLDYLIGEAKQFKLEFNLTNVFEMRGKEVI